MHWFLDPIKNHYFDFDGRATRQQFWMFVLIYILIAIVLAITEAMVGLEEILTSIYSLALLLPYLGLAVRRLHDVNRSGWWILIGFIPIIGFIVLLIWYVKEGDSGANQYGPNPLAAEGVETSAPSDGTADTSTMASNAPQPGQPSEQTPDERM